MARVPVMGTPYKARPPVEAHARREIKPIRATWGTIRRNRPAIVRSKGARDIAIKISAWRRRYAPLIIDADPLNEGFPGQRQKALSVPISEHFWIGRKADVPPAAAPYLHSCWILSSA